MIYQIKNIRSITIGLFVIYFKKFDIHLFVSFLHTQDCAGWIRFYSYTRRKNSVFKRECEVKSTT